MSSLLSENEPLQAPGRSTHTLETFDSWEGRAADRSVQGLLSRALTSETAGTERIPAGGGPELSLDRLSESKKSTSERGARIEQRGAKMGWSAETRQQCVFLGE